MERILLERIRHSLLEKKDNLTTWLTTTPDPKRRVRLGSSTEQAVYAHLETLDNAVVKSAAGTIGRCEVCHETIEPRLLEMDYSCCVCLEHLSAKEARLLEAELELAQSVQQTLLPQLVPQIPGLDIAAYSRPAQIVGGDYFDFFGFRDGRHGLTIADVAGHGVSASLHMASIQTLLRTLAPMSATPVEVVRQVQHVYSHNIRFTTFATVFLGAYDAAGRTLTYCSAGHNPPLLMQSLGPEKENPLWLRPTGPAIGLVEDFEYGEGAIALRPGDVLVLYTDGVTEAANANDEEYGAERLAALVRRARTRAASEIIRAVRGELEEFSGGRQLADDTTIVVCRTLDTR